MSTGLRPAPISPNLVTGWAVVVRNRPTALVITHTHSDDCWEPVGQHDNYGFALAAQPGGSQGRPTTNTSSRLIV
jgi:hypothetical protein